MKKLFALTLAVAMVLSMASVAFAADNNCSYLFINPELMGKISDHVWNIIGSFEDEKYTAFYGDELFFYVSETIYNEDGTYVDIPYITDDDFIKKYKLSYDFSNGEEFIDSVEWKKAYFNGDVAYGINIVTKDMPEALDAEDIIGTIKVKSSSNYYVDDMRYRTQNGMKEYKLDVAFTLNPRMADNENIAAAPGLDKTADGDFVYDFSSSEDEEFELELFAGMGRFEVNTIGQGKLVINTDVDYNEGIEGVAADVNYVYFNSNNPTFNRLGTLYLTADEDDILYKVNKDGSLTKMDAKYDEDEEAFAVRTRVIGSYVIAEEELNVEKVNAAVAGAPAAPVTPANPSTGAAC